jgi:hypothetical protein
MVTSNRLGSADVRTENSAGTAAQQFVVTLSDSFALEARRTLQQWKQIADNINPDLKLPVALDGAAAVPVTPQASTSALHLVAALVDKKNDAPLAAVHTPPGASKVAEVRVDLSPNVGVAGDGKETSDGK